MFTQLSYRKRGPNLYSFRWRAEVKSNHSEFYPKVVVWKREQDDQPSNLVNGIPHLQIYITVMYIYIYICNFLLSSFAPFLHVWSIRKKCTKWSNQRPPPIPRCEWLNLWNHVEFRLTLCLPSSKWLTKTDTVSKCFRNLQIYNIL